MNKEKRYLPVSREVFAHLITVIHQLKKIYQEIESIRINKLKKKNLDLEIKILEMIIDKTRNNYGNTTFYSKQP